jgi:hypothetical protein
LLSTTRRTKAIPKILRGSGTQLLLLQDYGEPPWHG